MFAKIKYILAFIALLVTVIIAFSCSPQQRMARLVKKHPELADTTFITKTITAPGVTVTSKEPAKANTDVTGLYAIINALGNKVDEFTKEALKKEVATYIVNRKCLEDPLTVHLPNGGLFKLWQDGAGFHHSLQLPERKYNLSFPMVTLNLSYKINWQAAAGGFIAGVFFILMAAMALIKVRQNTP